MVDRPILFSAPMVRALLAGTKTQTRRALSVPMWPGVNPAFTGLEAVRETTGRWRIYGTEPASDFFKVPAAAGDRLWVKETWQGGSTGDGPAVAYRADNNRWYPPFTGPSEGRGPTFDYDAFPTTAWQKGHWLADVESGGPWASPLHMSRWMSRLTLHVTDVRVQRLQSISESDAIAEGMTQETADAIMSPDELAVFASTHILCPDARGRILYETIWGQINGAGSWAANPWIAAYTFTVERANIDQARAAA